MESKISLEMKHNLFVDAYIANGFKVGAASLAAGYSAKGAATQGTRLLNDVRVQKILAERMAPQIQKRELSKETVMQVYEALITSNMSSFLKVTNAGRDVEMVLPDPADPDYMQKMAAIDEVTIYEDPETGKKKIKVRLAPKTPALNGVSKVLDMVTDKMEISAPGGMPLNVGLDLTALDSDQRDSLRDILDREKEKNAE